MEEKTRAKDNLVCLQEQPASRAEPNNHSVTIQKHLVRNKREALKEKRKMKGVTLQPDDVDTDHVSTRPKQDEVGSVTSQDSQNISSQPRQLIPSNLSSILGKIVAKPTYLTFVNSSTFVGSFGHSSAFLKRPALQGVSFIQFRLKEDAKKDKPCSFASSARVGICLPTFDPAFPLGCGSSIAYKSIDGSIIRENQKIGVAEPWSVGDLISVCLQLRPFHKKQDPSKLDEGSRLKFFKNGKLVYQLQQIRQEFYCFGVSLYNYSQMEMIKKGTNSIGLNPESHYLASLTRKLPYKDLSSNKLFKI